LAPGEDVVAGGTAVGDRDNASPDPNEVGEVALAVVNQPFLKKVTPAINEPNNQMDDGIGTGDATKSYE
jgi:hypothetical protein